MTIALIPESHIEELEKGKAEKFSRLMESYQQSSISGNVTKQEWMEVFGKCLSPRVACKRVGVSYGTYQKWRNTDPDFCRAINHYITLAYEELQASVMNRAIGYLEEDDNGEVVTDAMGRPVYSGGSDALAKAIMQQEGEMQADTVIEIKWGDDERVATIEGEVVKDDEDAA